MIRVIIQISFLAKTIYQIYLECCNCCKQSENYRKCCSNSS